MSKRWVFFFQGLELEKRIEFNDGDVGLAGGVQAQELASANPTTVEAISRFGASTAPSTQWPEEDTGDDDTDKFETRKKRFDQSPP